MNLGKTELRTEFQHKFRTHLQHDIFLDLSTLPALELKLPYLLA